MPNPVDLPDRPVALQGVPAPGYSAIDLRRLAASQLHQEGVVASGDFKVNPGAGRTVSIAAGEAAVQGDSVTHQGRYYQRSSAAVVVDVDVAHATLPRIDQVVIELKDDAADGSGLNVGRLRVIPGTATAGATLDNRLGVAALPNTACRIADVLVPAAFAGPFVANTHIRDRRPWAPGAFHYQRLNTGDVAAPVVAAAAATAVNAAAMAPRIETSPGAQLRITARGHFFHSAAGNVVTYRPSIDGVFDFGGLDLGFTPPAVAVNIDSAFTMQTVWASVPAAGSHIFSLYHYTGNAAGTTRANNSRPLDFIVEELPARQNANNS